MWWRLFQEVAAEYPDVTTDYMHIDAAMIFMTTDPARFDVIVTDNLFGDIITDLAAAITGGIGLAASGNINPDRTAPSMFEPVHGSAPDIAGQQKADPTAAILSAALLLDHLGHADAAAAVEAAVIADLAERDAGPGAAYLRGRRRDRGTPRLTPQDRDTLMSMEISTTLSQHPVDDARLAEILADPGFGTHFTDHMFTVEWTPEAGWHAARIEPYGPLTPRPGDGRPALRAGDLRGHEGLPPRGRLDLDVPARRERRADGALEPPARVPGPARSRTSSRPSTRW